MSARCVPLALALLVGVSAAHAADEPRFALLVGVDKYPNLPASAQLRGARNDVGLMRQTLLDRFRFPPEAVTTLLDEQATGKAIRQALDDLAARIDKLPQKGPVVPVVVHFSGHGSQVPDQKEGDSDQDEDDGLDETLVPHDATAQGGAEDVRDDELNRFVHRAAAHPRVHLWVVLDCCHSGTGVRASADNVFRQYVRKVPDELKSRQRDTGIETGVKATARKTLPPNVVVLSACRADEEEPEFSDQGKSYGLLSYGLARVLAQSGAVSKLSYAGLRRAVELTYAQEGLGSAPAPQLEGSPKSIQGPVLGSGEADDEAPLWTVEALGKKRGVARVKAGRLQGLTVGALLEAFPTGEAARGDKAPLALLRIERLEAGQADTTVLGWEDESRTTLAASSLPDEFKRGVARLRQVGLSAPTLRLRVLRVDPKGETILGVKEASVPEAVRKGLTAASPGGPTGWLTWLEPADADADLVLKLDGDHAAFFPTTGLTPPPGLKTSGRAVPASLRGGWGPIELSSAAAPGQLRDYLKRISKARNLLRLTAELERAGSALAVELEMGKVKLDARQAIEEFEALALAEKAPPDLARGTLYAYRLTNKGSKPAFVTLFSVSRDLGIEMVFPFADVGAAEDEQRLGAGKARFTDAFEVGDPLGDRALVLIVTSDPVNLSYLAQDQLPKIEKGSAQATHPIGELLQSQASFRPPAFKGMDIRPDRSEWSLRLFRWRAVP